MPTISPMVRWGTFTHARLTHGALVAMAATLVIAACASMALDRAQGASSNQAVSVTVASATTLDVSGCVTGTLNVTDFGTVMPATSNITSGDCSVVFGSSNDTAMLRLHQVDGMGSGLWRPSDGTLDATFDTIQLDGKVTSAIGTADDSARGITVQPDGKIVLVGVSVSAATGQDFAAARYNADGSLDTTFSGDGKVTTPVAVGPDNDSAAAVAIQPDGKVVLAGMVGGGAADPINDVGLVRYNADGTLDTSFSSDGIVTYDNAGAYELGFSVAVQQDGRILVAGIYNSQIGVARFTQSGTLDTSFDGDGVQSTAVGATSSGADIAVEPDGDIVVAGRADMGATDDVAVVRYTPAGAPDPSFSGDGIVTTPVGAGHDRANAIALQASGLIVVAGREGSGVNGNIAVVRYTSAGAPDPSFSGDGMVITPVGVDLDEAHDVAVLPDDRVVVSGNWWSGTSTDMLVARYTSAGVLDTTFDPVGRDGVVSTTFAATGAERGYGLAQYPDGKLVMAGEWYNGADFDFAVVRYDAVTVADFAAASADWAAGTNTFGACLRSVAAGASTDGTTWGTDAVDADCADGNADPWMPIAPTSASGGAKVAQSTGAGIITARANLRFGFRASPSQPAGSYIAPVSFEVVAPSAP